MTKEIAEVLGAIAAAFVGTILIDMWLGGGLLSALAPGKFESGFMSGGVAPAAPAGASPAPVGGSGTSGGTTAGGVMSVPV